MLSRRILLRVFRYLGLSILFILALFVFYLFIILKPSNNRNWEFGYETLPTLTINDQSIDIHNLRDYQLRPDKSVSGNYRERSIDPDRIQKVWFMVEPFGKFSAVAHTYFTFDFQNEDPLVISIEARREKGEQYEAFRGAFNNFELMYVWGTEGDETIRRIVHEHNKVYMYPLNISQNGAMQLLAQLASETHKLETRPRFYNTIVSNCTNELAKAANRVKPGTIPFNLGLFLPGLSVNELYKLGLIPNNIPLEKVMEKYFISDFVNRSYTDSDFSSKLRSFLN